MKTWLALITAACAGAAVHDLAGRVTKLDCRFADQPAATTSGVISSTYNTDAVFMPSSVSTAIEIAAGDGCNTCKCSGEWCSCTLIACRGIWP